MANNTKSDVDVVEKESVPMTLTLRDVVFIIAAVVSMVTAWGLFGTRLSVVEEKIIFISSNISEIREIVRDLKRDDYKTGDAIHNELRRLELRLRNVENGQAQLTILLKDRNNKIK